jgi:hypothetical protein
LDEAEREEEREELIREAGRQQAERDRSKQDKDGTRADHGKDSANGPESKPPQDRPDQQPFFEGDSDEDRQDWISERMGSSLQCSDSNGSRGGGDDSGNGNGGGRDGSVGNRAWLDDDMPRCISYEINPGQFIVGTLDNKIAEIVRRSTLDKITSQIKTTVVQIKTFTACKPVKVTKHISPLSFLEAQDKYTIEFKGSEPSGCFIARHRSLYEIISLLKNGNALTDRGIEIALQAQIKGFEKAGLLDVNDSMDYTGFFPSATNNKIISSNIRIPEKYPDVTDSLKFIDELEGWYKGREDLLSHICHWFMIAPFSFIFKVINAPLLEWVHLWGNPNTGKTSSGLIGLAFDNNEDDEDFNLNMKHIDSLARFGDTILDTTFPKIINEVDLTERPDIVNHIVTAVDAIKFRKTLDRNRNAEYSPGLTPLFLTGNPQAPTKPEYVKRVKTRFSTEKEVHLPNSPEAVEYKRWLAVNIKRGRSLGQFRNKFAMEPRGQEIILDTNLTLFERSMRIWIAIYESAGRKLPLFFDKRLEEHQMHESIEDKKSSVLNALEAWIVDKCRTLDTNRGEYGNGGEKKILDEYSESIDRLAKLVDRKLVPYVKRDKDGKFVFSSQIIVELERSGSKQLDLPSLADAIPGAEYGKLSHGYRVVKCSAANLTAAFFDEGIAG